MSSAAPSSVRTRALRAPRPKGQILPKGQQTHAAILDTALALASQRGLEGLSIGTVAEAAGMSKSGVFAHFGSREELQISVIREYHARFKAEVFAPAMQEARGLPRLAALFERWVQRVTKEVVSGCLYISGAVEFDDRPGLVRDALLAMVATWQDALLRAIHLSRQEGHLKPDTDEHQFLFEMHGLILSLHHDARFLRRPGAPDHARRGLSQLLAPRVSAEGRRLLAQIKQRPTSPAAAGHCANQIHPGPRR